MIGNLTADPQTFTTQSGASAAHFTLAVQRKYKNDQGGYDADFIRCTAWRGTGEYIGKYGAKGRKLAVHGILQSRSYDKDGQKHTVIDVIVEDAEFVDKPSEQAAKPQTEKPTFTEVDDPELPF